MVLKFLNLIKVIKLVNHSSVNIGLLNNLGHTLKCLIAKPVSDTHSECDPISATDLISEKYTPGPDIVSFDTRTPEYEVYINKPKNKFTKLSTLAELRVVSIRGPVNKNDLVVKIKFYLDVVLLNNIFLGL